MACHQPFNLIGLRGVAAEKPMFAYQPEIAGLHLPLLVKLGCAVDLRLGVVKFIVGA